MAIWLDHRSKVIVQGMTGSEGRKHTQRMVMFGTRVVAGVTPARATVDRVRGGPGSGVQHRGRGAARNRRPCRSSSVPARFTKAAVMDAIGGGVKLIVVITEGIRGADTAEFYSAAVDAGVQIIGPNCPGIISPGRSNVGIIPPNITRPGHIGLVSKSGTLTYQMMYELGDIGFSTAASGSVATPSSDDPHRCLQAFEDDLTPTRS